MQSERITILTSPAAKRTIAARASANGLSMGEYVRRRALEGEDELTAKEEAELSALAAEVTIAIPKMQASIDRMIATLDKSHQETDAFLRKMGVR